MNNQITYLEAGDPGATLERLELTHQLRTLLPETRKEMKTRPVVMSGHEVRAILSGIKTQIRRVIKAPDSLTGFRHFRNNEWDRMQGGVRGDTVLCPYGHTGDRLFVRETWSREFEGGVCYRADDAPGEVAEFVDAQGNPIKGSRWKPSIHMPRWASRITLEITGVRVERLQDISDTECVREGVTAAECIDCDGWVNAYSRLWESLNGTGTWDANPWVWVVEFKRVGGGA